ncbi:hypothetical protein [Chitinibacter tainanensis]|uniref:hypothetical protein n=1 Tax=Chitinibacter tainanensis TaxID=230667 RepID=UPI0012EB34A3|nr:hypothetical protein [Chitinibacter tainanensis]
MHLPPVMTTQSQTMPIRPINYADDLSTAIAQYLANASEVLKRVDSLLAVELKSQVNPPHHPARG